MYIDQLRLKYFRNYDSCSIDLIPGVNVFIGKNGQGKTNLLESVYFMSTTKSHRGIDDVQLIQFNQDFSCIDAHVCYEDQMSSYSCVIHKKGKTLCIRNQPVKKVSEFIGKINAVLFSPLDMNLFDASPKYRRRFMDVELGKMSMRYIGQLNQYNQLLKERNAYLKQDKVDSILLDTITEQMMEPQLQIIKKRFLFIRQLNDYVPNLYQKMSASDDVVRVHYQCMIEYNVDDALMIQQLQQKFASVKDRDLLLRMTNTGIHREDIAFTLNGHDVNVVASQGQKRMIIVALKLALVSIIHEYTGEYPILLLDDVLSELDVQKKNRLIHLLPKEVQTIITTTEKDDLLQSVIDQSLIYVVEKGSAKKWTI